MDFQPPRLLATPKAFALLADPANVGDHRAVQRAIELATDPNAKRKTGYLIQGSPLAIAAKWATEPGVESVLILFGNGEMGRIADLEKDCVPLSLS